MTRLSISLAQSRREHYKKKVVNKKLAQTIVGGYLIILLARLRQP